MQSIDLIWLIPALPLAGAAVLGLFGGMLTKAGLRVQAGIAASFIVLLSLLLSIWVAIDAADGQTRIYSLYNWIPSGDFNVDIGFYVDPLTAVMLLVVTGVATLVHFYSLGYMREDARDPSVAHHGGHDDHGAPGDAAHGAVSSEHVADDAHGLQHADSGDTTAAETGAGGLAVLRKDGGMVRFFAFLNLFVFSMLVLVLANNYLLLFTGWELVGLSSYLLIGFWYQKKSATDASKKAFIVNRIGDFGFTLGILMLFVNFGTLAYADVFNKAPDQTFVLGNMTITCLLLFMGAMGKSAQFPIHVWLPDAMEGPTPVSALIHAATMVTAGVYLVARSNPLFHLAPDAGLVVMTVGTVTALLGATIALVNTDIKRVVAYSTVSQLGYMFAAAGAGAYSASVFHLFTHAFFKGLLFLGCGAVIHSMHFLESQGKDPQDIRNMGGLFRYMPITATTFIIGSLANAAIIPFAGFWSKDEIIAALIFLGPENAKTAALIAAVLLLVGSFLTAFYMFRLVFLVFFNRRKWELSKDPHERPHESPLTMTIPLMILAGAAIVVGFLGFPPEHGAFHQFIGGVFGAHEGEIDPTQSLQLQLLSTLIAASGIGVAWFMYARPSSLPETLANGFSGLYTLLKNRWGFDELYDVVFVRGGKWLATALWAFDRNVIDGAVNGVAGFFGWGGGRLRRIQTGFVANYAMAIALGVIGLMTYLVFVSIGR